MAALKDSNVKKGRSGLIARSAASSRLDAEHTHTQGDHGLTSTSDDASAVKGLIQHLPLPIPHVYFTGHHLLAYTCYSYHRLTTAIRTGSVLPFYLSSYHSEMHYDEWVEKVIIKKLFYRESIRLLPI